MGLWSKIVHPVSHAIFGKSSSGGGGEAFDKEYNKRLADISERKQAMAEEQFAFWKEAHKPMEEAQIEANMLLMPFELDARKSELDFNRWKYEMEKEMYPMKRDNMALDLELKGWSLENERAMSPLKIETMETNLDKLKMARDAQGLDLENKILLNPYLRDATQADLIYQKNLSEDNLLGLQQRAPVRKAFYHSALQGFDPEAQANRAAADAAQAFAGSSAAMSRNAARFGVNPNSGRFAAMNNSNAIQRAQQIGHARTQGRLQGEQENFNRLAAAMGG